MIDTGLCLLVGGESRRMGQDKAQLRMSSGKMLVEKMVGMLELFPEGKIFLSGEKQFTGLTELINIPDIFTIKVGPVGAIVSCCKFINNNFPQINKLLFIPVDLPILTIDSLNKLSMSYSAAAYFKEHPLPLKLNLNQNLMAVVNELTPIIEEDGGYPVRRFIEKLDSYETLTIANPDELLNFNYPDQWQEFIKDYHNN